MSVATTDSGRRARKALPVACSLIPVHAGGWRAPMPRRSAASQMMTLLPGERPSPPDGMSDAELRIWHELTDNLPPTRLDAGFVTLCRVLVQHIVYCRAAGHEADRLLKHPEAWSDPVRRKALRLALRDHSQQSERV